MRSTPGQRLLLVFLGLALALVLLAAAEGVLALLGAGEAHLYEDPFVGFEPGRDLFVETVLPGGERVWATSPEKLAFFNPQQFALRKPPGAYRVFALGGSTTAGRPYDARVAFPAWLQRYLDAAEPGRRHEVVNAGGISYASYRVVVLMKELARHDPDLFVVYTGHNEFLEERTYSEIIHQRPAVKKLRLALNRYRLPTLLRHAWLGSRRSQGETPATLQAEVVTRLEGWTGLDRYHRDPELRRSVEEHFAFNLRQIAAIAEAAGAGLVFVAPVSNLKDFSPFKSEAAPELSPSGRQRLDRLLAQGRSLLAAGRPEEALGPVSEAVELDATHAEAQFLLGTAHFRLGDHEAARRHFVLAKDHDVAPLRALESMVGEVSRVAAERRLPLVDLPAILAAEGRGRLGHGIPGNEVLLDHVHPDIPVHALIAERLLEMLARRGEVRLDPSWSEERRRRVYDDAIAALDRRYYAQRDLNLAKVLGWAGKLAEAEAPLLRAAPLLPDEPEIPLNLGILYQKTGRQEQAIEALRRAVAMAPESPEARFNLGVSLGAAGRVEEAIAELRRALGLRPGYAEAWFNLAALHRARGEHDEALAALAEVGRLRGPSFELALREGAVLRRAGRLAEAEDALRRALERDPASPEALTELAIVAARRQRPEEARRHLEQAISADPAWTEAHFHLGVVLSGAGLREDAMLSYRRALETAPEHAEARNNLGVLLGRAGRLEEAEAELRRAVAARPEWAEAHLNLAVVLDQSGRAPEALESMRRAAELAPEDGRAQIGLAALHLALGRRDLAARHLARAEALGASPPPDLVRALRP